MGASFGSNPLRAHFGLGKADKVEFVEVKWPASGESQRIEGVTAGVAIRIEQGRPGFEKLERTAAKPGN